MCAEGVHGPCSKTDQLRHVWSAKTVLLLPCQTTQGSSQCPVLPHVPHSHTTAGQFTVLPHVPHSHTTAGHYCHTFFTATPQQVITATRPSQPHQNSSVLPHVPHSHATTGQYCHTFLTATPQQLSTDTPQQVITATRSSQPHHSKSVYSTAMRALQPIHVSYHIIFYID